MTSSEPASIVVAVRRKSVLNVVILNLVRKLKRPWEAIYEDFNLSGEQKGFTCDFKLLLSLFCMWSSLNWITRLFCCPRWHSRWFLFFFFTGLSRGISRIAKSLPSYSHCHSHLLLWSTLHFVSNFQYHDEILVEKFTSLAIILSQSRIWFNFESSNFQSWHVWLRLSCNWPTAKKSILTIRHNFLFICVYSIFVLYSLSYTSKIGFSPCINTFEFIHQTIMYPTQFPLL
jgi:hypothetical protein